MKLKIPKDKASEIAAAAKLAQSIPDLSEFMDKLQARLDEYDKAEKPVVEARPTSHR